MQTHPSPGRLAALARNYMSQARRGRQDARLAPRDTGKRAPRSPDHGCVEWYIYDHEEGDRRPERSPT